MKRVFRFSRYYLAAALVSTALIIFGIVGYAVKGFNLGVDFQAGINQTVQLAYPAFKLTYEGKGNAEFTVGETGATLVFSGAEIENRTESFDFAAYPSLGEFAAAIQAIPQVTVALEPGAEAAASSLLVPTYQGNTLLSSAAMVIHRAPMNDTEAFGSIGEVRDALRGGGEVSVQQAKPVSLQRYIIRVQDEGTDKAFSQTARKLITNSLETKFGADHVVVLRTDYVGARYSQSLAKQSGLVILGTVLVIMLYAGLRFKFQYGFAAVLAILHDALIMVMFIVWTRMEFNTTTIAAILTILGYSINDTIVQFDRVREERKLRPGEKFADVIDYALTVTFGRTLITTATTMLTVLALFFFTSGSMKDFALALLVGMVSGTYSTIFIASGFVLWYDGFSARRNSRKRMKTVPAAAQKNVSPAKAGAKKIALKKAEGN
ncbi:MAG: protein translocase subunit SecF [Rectinemataceae bacterium]